MTFNGYLCAEKATETNRVRWSVRKTERVGAKERSQKFTGCCFQACVAFLRNQQQPGGNYPGYVVFGRANLREEDKLMSGTSERHRPLVASTKCDFINKRKHMCAYNLLRVITWNKNSRTVDSRCADSVVRSLSRVLRVRTINLHRTSRRSFGKKGLAMRAIVIAVVIRLRLTGSAQ